MNGIDDGSQRRVSTAERNHCGQQSPRRAILTSRTWRFEDALSAVAAFMARETEQGNENGEAAPLLAGAATLAPRRRRSSSRLLLPPRPDDERCRQLPGSAQYQPNTGSSSTMRMPRSRSTSATEPSRFSRSKGGSIGLSDDRHRTPTFSIVLEVVEAGVAVTNRLAAAAAATGSRVAGPERVDWKPGDADLPLEECAESCRKRFASARLSASSSSPGRWGCGEDKKCPGLCPQAAFVGKVPALLSGQIS